MLNSDGRRVATLEVPMVAVALTGLSSLLLPTVTQLLKHNKEAEDLEV